MKLRMVLLIISLIILLAACVFYVEMQSSRPSNGASESAPGGVNPERSRRKTQAPDETAGGSCQTLGVTCASQYFAAWTWPASGSCTTSIRNGFPVPDPKCTPGGVVPDVTIEVLRDPLWRTRCVRNCQSSESQKHVAYEWYGLARPFENNGENQVCELDHLVPLELGGADGLGNIWPQCGPAESDLRDRYFKRKDQVEGYLAAKVRAGEMPLEEAQRGIAADWTQYLAESENFRASGRSRRER
jgi:hypothetical protein